MDEWMGIIGTIIGVILGGLITWFLSEEQRKHDINKEKRELLLSKYEQIDTLLTEILGCVSSVALQIVAEAGLKSKIDPDAFKNGMPMDKTSMLINFYAPELHDGQEQLKKQTTFLYEHLFKHVSNVDKTEKFMAESAITAHELSKNTSITVKSMKAMLASKAGRLLETAYD